MDHQISAIVPADIESGTQVTYTVTIFHLANSSAPAYNVTFSSVLSEGLTLVSTSTSAGVEHSTQDALVIIPTILPSAEPVVITYTVNLNDDARGMLNSV